MRLELRRDIGGTHFVICLIGERRSGDAIAVPLSPDLSNRIETMLLLEGIQTELPVFERSG